jgi:hypothetical protein
MILHYPARTQLTGVTAATSTLTSAGHGLAAGQRVFFLGGTGFTGLTAGGVYFVRDVATDTFGLAATSGGAAIAVGTSSAGVLAAALEIWDGTFSGPTSPERLECGQSVQVRELFRAADAGIDARDNRRRRLPLSVPRGFTSVRLTEEYLVDHYETLASRGYLHFTLGTDTDSSTRMRAAVLEACTLRRTAGRVVTVDYVFYLEAP